MKLMKTKRIDLMLSIAGSDNTSGAGIQADIKTCQTLNSYCLSAITAVTSQNSKKVYKVVEVSNDMIESQIKTVLDEYQVDSIKIGLVKSIKQAKLILKILKKIKYSIPIVVDPIFKSSTNTIFNKKKDYIKIYKILSKLKPIFTPNLFELKILLNLKSNNILKLEEMIKIFNKKFQSLIVLTNAGSKKTSCEDFFLDEKKEVKKVSSNKLISKNTHGTGCSFSTALAVHLGKGLSIEKSVDLSKKLINLYISRAPNFKLNYGPMGHWL